MTQIGIFVMMAGRNAGGPETYEHALVRNLAELDKENEYCILGFNQRAVDSFRISQPNVRYRILGARSRVLSMAVSLPVALKAEGVELLHAAYLPPPFSPVPSIMMLHCSSTFMHPEYYPASVRWRLNALIGRGVRRAEHILCVSGNVLELAAEHYGIPEERMSVVYDGVGEHFRPIAPEHRGSILARYGIAGRYMLFVGRFEPRKNVLRVLEAFNIFRHEVDNTMKLVLAGAKSWAQRAVDETIQRLGLGAHALKIGYVANEDMPGLYSGAELLVFPSLWEGFGIPVVEAMACGTPVLTANLSSLPEVAGGAAVLVDPYSVSEIAGAMERIVRDEALRAELRTQGMARARDFSWRRTAEQTLQTYLRVLRRERSMSRLSGSLELRS